MRHPFTRPARRITLTYVIIALIWITFSDKVVEVIFTDPALLNRVQTAKGIGFVLATGLLLCGLMLRTLHRIKVVAEGVETLEQAEFLQKNGCTVMQGYYYAKPMPITDLCALLSVLADNSVR
jgi:hypothetical protein